MDLVNLLSFHLEETMQRALPHIKYGSGFSKLPNVITSVRKQDLRDKELVITLAHQTDEKTKA